jgi:hypothetical protein
MGASKQLHMPTIVTLQENNLLHAEWEVEWDQRWCKGQASQAAARGTNMLQALQHYLNNRKYWYTQVFHTQKNLSENYLLGAHTLKNIRQPCPRLKMFEK